MAKCKSCGAAVGQGAQDIRKMIFEKQEYEERIRQIADMTGADPDLIKSRIEENAKMKGKTPMEAANEVKAALHLRDAYVEVEAEKAANEMMQDLARRLGEAFDQLGDIVKDMAEDLNRIMQQARDEYYERLVDEELVNDYKCKA